FGDSSEVDTRCRNATLCSVQHHNQMVKKPETQIQQVVSLELIERKIYVLRGHKVMLDADLAELYQVLTKNLNKAVARNKDRFPEDFMFQLTTEEAESLRFQIGTSKPSGRGGRRYLPY